MLVLLFPVAAAGPSAGGFSSDNVEWIATVPTAAGTPEGGRLVGKYFYSTANQQGLLIWDVSKPTDPQLVGRFVSPHQFENEDVATNGKIALLTQAGDAAYSTQRLPVSSLVVLDVEDKTNPTEIAKVPGAGDHTYDCLLNCRWAWSPTGFVIDLRDPSKPIFHDEKWTDVTPFAGYQIPTHDVTEVAPGIVLTASQPMLLLDARKDPVHPKLLARSDGSGHSGHNVIWPRRMEDNIVMSATENINPHCTANLGEALFKTWDASGWRRTHSIRPLDQWGPQNGTYADGDPAFSGGPGWYGCSAHWFQEHPSFHNGGLVAGSFYGHGVKFLQISAQGKIKPVGYFLPHQGASSAAYWITDEIVYSVDLNRGIDILRFRNAP
jgi:hypothetical protein